MIKQNKGESAKKHNEQMSSFFCLVFFGLFKNRLFQMSVPVIVIIMAIFYLRHIILRIWPAYTATITVIWMIVAIEIVLSAAIGMPLKKIIIFRKK